MFRTSASAVAIFKQAGYPAFFRVIVRDSHAHRRRIELRNAREAIGYLLTMVAWLILLVWANITLTHLLYRRAVSRGQAKRVSFRMPGAPYTSWLVLLAIGFVPMILAIHEGAAITLYIVLSWFGLLIVAYRVTASWHPTRKAWN